jgi:hypothetical protein
MVGMFGKSTPTRLLLNWLKRNGYLNLTANFFSMIYSAGKQILTCINDLNKVHNVRKVGIVVRWMNCILCNTVASISTFTFSMTPGIGATASPNPLPPRDSNWNLGTGFWNSKLPVLKWTEHKLPNQNLYSHRFRSALSFYIDTEPHTDFWVDTGNVRFIVHMKDIYRYINKLKYFF